MSRPPPLLLAEAGIAMVAASAAIRILPFRRLASAMGSPREGAEGSAEQVAPIVRAIKAWSRRLPWRTLCFEEGLTAQWLLRRRGFAATLHYGAATVDGELKAHVWVKSGDTGVTGCEIANEYALLARFPEV